MTWAIVNALIVLPQEEGGPRLTTLRYDRSRILSLDRPPQWRDAVIDLRGQTVFPGLINAHDHLELNHYPRSKFRPVYDNAHQWGEDFLPRLETEPYRSLRQRPLDWQCRVGGIKNLRSGVTTVAHHNPLHRPLLRRDFPVRALRRYGWAHSLHFEPDVAKRWRVTPKDAPWIIHLAEGTDEAARAELQKLERLGCLQPNTVLVHGVGLSRQDRQRVLEAGAGLIWCPSTNLYLLGQTGEVQDFAAAGKLALGTDSLLTADGDLLDELRAAAATGQLDTIQLFRAVTTDAARLLRLNNVGTLLPGYAADFFVAPPMSDPYSGLLELRREQIAAVYRDGVEQLARFPSP